MHILNALDSIAHRSSYLALLNENIAALKLLIKIASFDQEFIQNIVKFPAMIDDLMDSSEFTKPFDLAEPSKKLTDQLNRSRGGHRATDEIYYVTLKTPRSLNWRYRS